MVRFFTLLLFLTSFTITSVLLAQKPCPKAAGLNASEITETSAKLSWTTDDAHDEYTVDVKHGAQTANFNFSEKTDVGFITVNGLTAGSSYRFRVKVKCDKGSGGSSQWFDFTTSGTKPDDNKSGGDNKCPDVEDMKVVEIADTGAILSWSGSDDHKSYKIDVMHAPQNPNYKWSSTTTDTSVTLTDLAPGRSYRFRVQASCSKGKSNSGWQTFTTTGVDSTGHGRCPKASNLAVIEVTDTSVVLTWLGNPENKSYQVDVHQKEHTPTFRLSEEVDTTALYVDGLVPGGNYKFRVKASCEKNSAGSSSWINFVTTGGDTTFNQCPKPRNLSVLETSDTSAILTWVARDSAESFILEIKSFAGTPSYSFDTVLTDTFYLVDDLLPESDYHFRVIANCTDGSSSGSSDWSKFRTLADTSQQNTVETLASAQASIETFPNPAEDNIVIQLPLEDLGFKTTITLLDLHGRVVSQHQYQEVPKNPLLNLEVANLNPGIYKLVVRSIGFSDYKTIMVK